MGLEWLLGMLPSWDWAARKVQQRRHPHRFEIDFGWRPPLFWFPSDPTRSFFRIVTVEVVAGKGEGLLIAEGEVEARTSPEDDWRAIASLDRFLSLPVDLDAGRGHDGRLDGSEVAKAIEKVLEPDGESVELRLQARDRHDTTVTSNVLATTLEDLRAERIKYV